MVTVQTLEDSVLITLVLQASTIEFELAVAIATLELGRVFGLLVS